MTPWTDAEINRFELRRAMFVRRGQSLADAEALGDRLALRDQEQDDRRMCIECRHMQHDGRCVVLSIPTVKTTLQRCHAFAWQVPGSTKVNQ